MKIPKDFLQFAQNETQEKLAKRYSVSNWTVYHWLRELRGMGVVIDRHRPIPEDFAEKAPKHNKRQLRQIYKASTVTIEKWSEECGVPIGSQAKIAARAFTYQNIPADFAEQVVGKSKMQLRKQYDVGRSTIEHWLKLSGIAVISYQKREMPEDFAKVAVTMTRHAARIYWRTADAVLDRWAAEAGIKYKPVISPGSNLNLGNNNTKLQSYDIRQDTYANRAADKLRRNGWKVHPCDEKGKYTTKIGLWRVGNVIVNEEELIQRSNRYAD